MNRLALSLLSLLLSSCAHTSLPTAAAPSDAMAGKKPDASWLDRIDAASRVGWVVSIQNRIRSNMAPLPGLPKNLSAEFLITQLPDGEIIAVKLLSSSGLSTFDDAVMQAILKSSPLPPPPRRAGFVRDLQIRYVSSDDPVAAPRPYIGVAIENVTKELASTRGLPEGVGIRIAKVDPGGPAANAGLAAGDIVLKAGKQAVNTTMEFVRIVTATRPGDTLPLEIWREGASDTHLLTIGQPPAKALSLASPHSPSRNPAVVYPQESRRAGEEGSTRLRVLVDRQGIPQSVEIDRSSGFARLDQAALDAVRLWHFVPASKDGVPMEGWVLVPIVFRLETTL